MSRQLYAIVIVALLSLTACGGGATNTPTAVPASAVAEPTEDQTRAVTDLATSMAVVQNPPTPEPNAQAATPRPEVKLSRTFKLEGLNGTLLSWQMHGNDGALCQTVSDAYLALQVQFENPASKAYILTHDGLHVVEANGQPPDTMGQGAVFFGKEGAGSIEIGENSAVETTLCSDLRAADQPETMILVLGPKDNEQGRVPLAP